MKNQFQSRNNELQNLVKAFEDSLTNQKTVFFLEEELEQLIDYYEQKEDLIKAISVTDKGNALFPFSSLFYIRKASIYTQLKLFVEAWQAIDKATSFDPLAKEIYLLRVDAYVAEGDMDSAVEELKELYHAANHEEKADVLLELLDVYEAFNERERMFKTLAKIIQRYPRNEEIVHRLWTYAKDNDACDEAIELFKENVEQTPYNFLAWYYLASCYRDVGLYEKAIEAYEFTIAIEDYYFAYWDYTICLQGVEQYNKAISTYKEMLELFNEEANIYIELGHCYIAKKQYVLATESYMKALDLAFDSGDKAEAHFYIGKAFLKNGDLQLAQSQFKTCTELKQKKTKYWNALAKVSQELFQLEEASAFYVKSLALDEDQPKVWRKLASVYFELGYNNAVLETLKSAMLILPNNAKNLYHYAGYLFHFGKTQNALFLLEQAIHLDKTKKNSIFALFPELKNNSYILELYSELED